MKQFLNLTTLRPHQQWKRPSYGKRNRILTDVTYLNNSLVGKGLHYDIDYDIDKKYFAAQQQKDQQRLADERQRQEDAKGVWSYRLKKTTLTRVLFLIALFIKMEVQRES